MIVDTSAWVEYLRKTGSPTHLALRSGVRTDKPIASPAVVVTELLTGSRSDRKASELLRLLNRFEIVEPESLGVYQEAARIHRICRRAGFKVRSMIDCLVAATALDKGRPLLARNRDFDIIARHTHLALVIPPGAGQSSPGQPGPGRTGAGRTGPGAPKKPTRGWSGE